MRPRACVALAVLCLFGSAAPAFAASASEGEVRKLAERAETDPVALADLRNVDVVDGRPVDLRRVLAVDGDELQSRLRTLAGRGSPSTSATDAQQRARTILRGRRYRPSSLPRPFKGFLDAFGRLLKKVFDPIGRLIPDAGSKAWLVVGGVVVALAVYIAYRLGRRRRSVQAEHATLLRTEGLRPDDLERAAREAEGAGRIADAIRLRFAAGLLRLDRAGAIEWHPSITSGNVRRRLRSPSFDRVATSFERVAYGKREPTADDLELSKSGWSDVLDSVA